MLVRMGIAMQQLAKPLATAHVVEAIEAVTGAVDASLAITR